MAQDNTTGQNILEGNQSSILDTQNQGILEGQTTQNFNDLLKRHPELDPTEQKSLFQSVLTGLSYLNRPLSTVAGFTKGIVEGDIEKAVRNAKKGFLGDKVYGFADVLKSIGITKLGSVDVPVLGSISGRGVAGFALDILLDPLQLVKLTGLTKAAYDSAGKILPKILPTPVLEQVGEVKKAFDTIVNSRLSAITKKVDDEIASKRLPIAAKAGAQFVNIPDITGKIGPETFEVTGPIAKEVAEESVELSMMNNEFLLADARQSRINELTTKFRSDVLPKLKEKFIGDYTPKLNANPELTKYLDVAGLLDDVVSENMDSLQLLRNVHAKSNRVIGAHFTDAVEKGFRSMITFGDYSPAQLAEKLGLPDVAVNKLKKADYFLAKSIDSVLDTVGNLPIFAQVKKALNFGTGIKELDIVLAKMKNIEQGKYSDAVRRGLQIVQEGNKLYGSLEPTDKLRFMRQVADFLESTNPYNNLSHYSTKEYLPGVVEFGNQLKHTLDDIFKNEKLSGMALGHDMRYLRGYFPRELTNEMKKFFGEVMEEQNIFQKLAPKTKQMRAEEFQRLTTGEINDLFRKNRLAFDDLVKGMQDPEKMKRLGILDKELQAYFSEDPAMVVANRLIRSQRNVSRNEQTASLLRIFGTNVFDKHTALESGETLFSPFEFFKDPQFGKLSLKEKKNLFAKLFPGEKWTRKNIDEIITGAKHLSARMMSRYFEGDSWVDNSLDAINEITDKANIGPIKAQRAMKLFAELPFNSPALFAQMYNIGIPIYKAPKEVVQVINEWWRVNNNPKTMGLLLKAYDYTSDLFKRTTTTIFPSTHFRNLMSDLYQNHLAGINPIKESVSSNGAYKLSFESLKDLGILGKQVDFENAVSSGFGKLASKFVVTSTGEKISLQKVFSDFLQQGGLTGILRDTPIKDTTPAEVIIEKLQSFWAKPGSRLNPLGKDFAPVVLGNKAAEIVGVHNRFSHFIAKIKQGYAPDEAMLSVKKFLFDYQDITNFERNVLRRVFPFYTWTRKNIPLQLEMMIKEPKKLMNAVRAAELLENDSSRKEIGEENIPDYIKKEWGIVTKKNKDGTYDFLMLGSYIPAADLIKIGSGQDFFRLMTKSLHPIPQAFIEKNINKNFFSGKPIKVPGRVSGTFLGINMDLNTVNALKKVRVLNTADKLFTKDDPDNPYFRKVQSIPEKLVSNITGLAQRKVDIEKIRLSEERLNRLVGNRLRQALKEAERTGNLEKVSEIRTLLKGE